MPRRMQPPRLYLRPARRNKQGKLRASAVWIILDGGKHIATGCVKGEDRTAQQALSAYITAKHEPARKERDIEAIDVADVLSIYDDDTRARQVNKAKFDERLKRLNDFWGGRMLSDVTGETCREYVSTRGTDGGPETKRPGSFGRAGAIKRCRSAIAAQTRVESFRPTNVRYGISRGLS